MSEDEWDDKSVADMDAMSENSRWNTIAMYLELPDDEAEKWPQKVVGRLFKIWESSGWLAVRNEMMRITTYSSDDETVRVLRADLERLARMTETDHNGDKWYTTVASWAQRVLKPLPTPKSIDPHKAGE